MAGRPAGALGHLHHPEEAWTIEEDFASDVYSAGVVFWELYHREEAFAGVSTEAVEKRVLAGEFLTIPTAPARSTVREAVVAALRTMFVMDPADRANIAAVNARLSSMLAH